MSRRLLAGLPLLLVAAAAVAQPPRIPHRIHMEEGLECVDCHEGVSDSRSAADYLMPDADMCLDCHDEGDVSLDWAPTPGELIFDHARHVESLDIDCATCHVGLEEEGWRAGGYLPAMDDCMTCHTGDAAPRDCEVCHTSDLAALRPPSHTPFWSEEHGAQADLAAAGCVPCHSVTECQECHDGALLLEQMSLGATRTTPFAPQLTGSAGTVLQGVHSLNFRFLHGIEARGKASDCLTCHELDSGDFCAECHNPAGSAGIRPAWHGAGNWVTLGVGSGGGRHAQLARQDIENCAACHESHGDDPVCLQCHVDRTPGLGNDPRTHSAGFDEDAEDMCYVCHISSTGVPAR